MITRIELLLFKCFETLRLPLSSLTLLSGANASGKSSVIQALVLLHQTMREHEWSTRLMLNGKTICLGTVADVIDKVNGRDTMEIGLEEDDERILQWVFAGERQEMSMRISAVKTREKTQKNPPNLKHLLPPQLDKRLLSLVEQVRDLTYITAERVGPREVYEHEDPQNMPVVGPRGEYAASVLYSGQDKRVIDELLVQGQPPTRLSQVKARMQMLFPGCDLEIGQVFNANAVTLGFRTSRETGFHRPIHVGYGLSQVFPIVVAALSLGKNNLLLIENPEVHLHPAGQALMGQFLAEVAQAGVQVIIETHSDHVLNGIRRAVKEHKITAERVALHFFTSRSSEESQVITPSLDEFGNIDSWPDGFFDQFEKDLFHFVDWDE